MARQHLIAAGCREKKKKEKEGEGRKGKRIRERRQLGPAH